VGTTISKQLRKILVPATDMCEKGELAISCAPIGLVAVRTPWKLQEGSQKQTNESPA
jgi:hypothetical protein